MIKAFKGIIVLQLILFLFLVNSQYEIYKFANTQMDSPICTVVSEDNGDIFIGGRRIQRYDKQGNLIETSQMHSDLVIKIFWTRMYLISVGQDGQVIKWNSNQLKYMGQINAPSGVRNADIRIDDQSRIALNYGDHIDEYQLELSMSLLNTYTIVQDKNLKTFWDVAYSKKNNGPYIWAVAVYATQGYRFRFTMDTKQYLEFKTVDFFMSINVHPRQDRHIMINSKGQYIYEVINPESYFMYYGFYNTGVAVYSSDGNNVLSSDSYNKIMLVWDANQKVVQKIRGWNCEIVSVSQNYGLVSALDKCGNIGIIYNQNQNSSFSVWFILIPLFVLIIIASIFGIQIFRKKRIAQQAIQEGYSNYSDQ